MKRKRKNDTQFKMCHAVKTTGSRDDEHAHVSVQTWVLLTFPIWILIAFLIDSWFLACNESVKEKC